MAALSPARQPVAAPSVAPPPPFVERRHRSRRAVDQLAHEETRLLARSLDVLAGADDPESRLAGLLDLLADTVGARRAALVADGDVRRVAVAADGQADMDEALALAAWLDASAPRSRARRAAAAAAPISVALRTVARGQQVRGQAAGGSGPWFAAVASRPRAKSPWASTSIDQAAPIGSPSGSRRPWLAMPPSRWPW